MRGRQISFVVFAMLVGLAFLFAIPLLWTVATALKSASEFAREPDRFVPRHIVFENFGKVWHALPFAFFVRNSLFVSVVATMATVVSSSLAAYGFARFRFRGRNLLFAALLGTMMLPAQITLLPVFLIWREARAIDTFVPLLAPSFFGSAFSVFLLRQFFLTIPHDLDEAATIDGASYLRIWWQVLMPISGTALATVGVFTFFANWDAFEGPLIYLNSEHNYTLAVGLRMFQDSEGSTRFEQVMAASLIQIVPTIIIFFCAQRYFLKGIALSGMGGR